MVPTTGQVAPVLAESLAQFGLLFITALHERVAQVSGQDQETLDQRGDDDADDDDWNRQHNAAHVPTDQH